jgi:hypothetical protein
MDPMSADLTGRMPIVAHESVPGVECCGCIIATVEGTNVELRCNECGAVVGVVQIDVLKGLLGLERAEDTCPHCGKVNTFQGFTDVTAYVCVECGKAVGAGDGGRRVEIQDDTCTWYEFDGGRPPIAVMNCNRCGKPPDVDEDGVRCPLCLRRSPVRSDDLEKVIEGWNEMVDSE